MAHKSNSNIDIHSDFRRLFFQKEGRALLGPKFRNLWVLVAIMFVTFAAIGFANGSLEYLRKKMANPFINWVNIPIPHSQTERVVKVRRDLGHADLMKEYDYQSVSGNSGFSLLVFENGRTDRSFYKRGRTIADGSPLLEKILADGNRVQGRTGFQGEMDIGLIVTTEMLESLGYDEDAAFIDMVYDLDTFNVAIPLPIVAVVKELPDFRDMVCTPYFFVQRFVDEYGDVPFHPYHTQSEVLFFIPGDKEVAFEFQQALEKYAKNDATFQAKYKDRRPYVSSPSPFTQPYVEGYLTGIRFMDEPYPPREEMDQIVVDILKNKSFSSFKNLKRIYTFNTSQRFEEPQHDYLAVHFNSLEKVRPFADFLALNHNINIDTAQIDAKENFHFISQLTRIISLILIGLSVLSICMFVSHVFRKHLDKISPNIGTFKAFGIDNQSLISTYLLMIGSFLLGAMGISLVLAWIFGQLGGVRVVLWAIGAKLERGQSYFELFNFWTLLAVGLVSLIGMAVLYTTARGILGRTPGDLIYGR